MTTYRGCARNFFGARPRLRAPILGALFALATLAACRQRASRGSQVVDFHIQVVDDSGNVLASRVHLRDANGNIWKPDNWPVFDDHFVYSGDANFRLPVGNYSYEVERGPEYKRTAGNFKVSSASKSMRVELAKLIDLPSQGWYPGDLHIHRRVEDVQLLMRAENLFVAPVITWWNGEDHSAEYRGAGRALQTFDGGRVIDATAGEDERAGGALLYFGLSKPIALPPLMVEDDKIVHRLGDVHDEYPPMAEFARGARSQPNAHVDVEKPFWWDMPTWVALGLVDSIEIAHNHMDRSSIHNSEAWGKSRDKRAYGPSLHANGYWTQDIYYRLLDAGVRIAPSAGSASGVLANPLGYDRVYVHAGAQLNYAEWWKGLRDGHSFVTNGPLLLATANNEVPGTIFSPSDAGPFTLELSVKLVSNDAIGRVEVVRDGVVSQQGSWDPIAGTVSFKPEAFSGSGWLLVRAICDRQDTFRFASSAPFYVEIGASKRRISKRAAQFFIGWVNERIQMLRKNMSESDKLEAVLSPHEAALRFWQTQLARATAE